MFENPKYITRGIRTEIPSWLVILLWNQVAMMQVSQKDYLQIFRLTKTERGQHIIHEQEQSLYKKEFIVPCTDAVDAKVYVIDNDAYSTMLLAEEY